jgi:hypothetical protein
MMGGRRYMKKRSSLKTRMWELFPLVVSRMTTPVHSPCHVTGKRRGVSTRSGRAEHVRWESRSAFFDETRRRSVGLAYNDERGHGLVHPAVLLEEVAEDDAGAEQRHEEVDVDDGGVVGGRAEHAQARHQAGAHGLAVAVAAERSRRRRRRDPPRKKKDANFVLPELVLLLGIELGRNKVEAFFFSSSG